MCIDFRRLNECVQILSHPVPLIDDILSTLNSCTYFTCLDLFSGYHQVGLTEGAAPKTSFSCFKGKFEYKVMPFGLSNAPSSFQRMANKLLMGLEDFATACTSTTF